MIQLAPKAPGFVEVAVGNINGVTGGFKVEELGMGNVVTEVVELPEELRYADPSQPSHLAVVKRAEEGPGYGLLFGGDFLIDNQAVIALYHPATQTLECFHCNQCAVIVWQWVKSKQHEWESIFSRSVDESSDTGPKRTLN